MALNRSYEVSEFESLMSLDNPINSASTKATRWERKLGASAGSSGQSMHGVGGMKGFSSSGGFPVAGSSNGVHLGNGGNPSGGGHGVFGFGKGSSMPGGVDNDSCCPSSSIDNYTNGSSSRHPLSLASNSVDNEIIMDRYIPSRSNSMDLDLSSSFSEEQNLAPDGACGQSEIYSKYLTEGHAISTSPRVLAFKNKAPTPKDGFQNGLKVLYSSQSGMKKSEIVKPTRHIPSAPVRILDAPALKDDYYLNVMSWGSNNTLAVALSERLYLWDAATGSINELMYVDADANDYITSVSWIQQGATHIAIGTASNTVQLWDVQAGKMVRSMRGHAARVSSLAWNNHMLSSGSKDTTIMNHDVRVQNHVQGVLRHHTQEVCGLQWSADGQYLASGANDNTLCIWDQASSLSMNGAPFQTMTDHQAAVKAVAWCPHERHLLATGGGTADRCIKFWNAGTGSLLNSVDTGSQVCALQWSPFEKELLSSHGYAENQLCLWKYPTMTKMKELKGHTSRVLHLATSPDGSMVCSAAADETLRFWNVFASEGKRKDGMSMAGPSGIGNMCIR
jgi:cell division cycle protein 20 (cofactor of APC complex)